MHIICGWEDFDGCSHVHSGCCLWSRGTYKRENTYNIKTLNEMGGILANILYTQEALRIRIRIRIKIGNLIYTGATTSPWATIKVPSHSGTTLTTDGELGE